MLSIDDLLPRHAHTRLGFGATRTNMPSKAFDQVFASIAHDRARPSNITEADLARYSDHHAIASTPLDELGEGRAKLTSRWHCVCRTTHHLHSDIDVPQDRKDWVTTAAECFTLLEHTVRRLEDMTHDIRRFLPDQLMRNAAPEAVSLWKASLPTDYFIYAVTQVVVWTGMKWLDISHDRSVHAHNTNRIITKGEAFAKLTDLLRRMGKVYIIDRRVSIAFARATDTLMTFYVQRKWSSDGGQLRIDDFEMLFKTDFAPKLQNLMTLVPLLQADAVNLDKSPLYQDMPNGPEPPEVERIVQLGMDKLELLMSKRLYSMIVTGQVENDEEIMQDYRVSSYFLR